MERVYTGVLREHFEENRQMAFLSGPRQVGKTTTVRDGMPESAYLNWDRTTDRALIVGEGSGLVERLGLDMIAGNPSSVIFDEIHKYPQWKLFLKGFFDTYGQRVRVAVTGSARLNIYKKGGDSLMGRYFLYRMHPLTVGEIGSVAFVEDMVKKPVRPEPSILKSLLQFGGFPEPFLKSNIRFYNRWRRLRSEQLFNEDIRDLTNIQEVKQLEVLAELLTHQVGQLVNLSSLAGQTGMSVDTISRWVSTLESVYFCYTIRPWFRNVPKSLRKQPKIYLWDWSLVTDPGSRAENLVASHLLKAVEFWTDAGLGNFGLHFLRDSTKREVDFLVTRDGVPWFLAEVKTSASGRLSKSLRYYHALLGTAHAFQIILDADYIDEDCFSHSEPIKVPAVTLLSQLV